METAIEVVDSTLSVPVLHARMVKIREAMGAVMEDKKHYGLIPGCGKPSLWKAGAEVLATMFQIAPHCTAEDLSDGEHVRYRVTCEGRSIVTGAVLGTSLGECSTGEEKYCWRAVVCDQEWEETAPDHRRNKWKKGKEPYQVKQVRTSPADLANTVLKMAEKRAFIGMIRTVTSCSDLFTQDMEELKSQIDVGDDKPPMRQPKAKTDKPKASTPAPAGNVISKPQGKRLYAITMKAGVDKEAVVAKLAEYGFGHSKEITKDKYEEICDWVESFTEGT